MNFHILDSYSKMIVPVALSVLIVGTAMNAQADMTETSVQNYAAVMKQAANSKNIAKVSSLVADDALISMSRLGKTTSLDKKAYLKLLQNSWSQTTNYKYDIDISNVVTSGTQAKADVTTIESWTKNGKDTVLTTSSRATLKEASNNAILLRAVSQVSIK